MRTAAGILAIFLAVISAGVRADLPAVTVTIDTASGAREQTIDGFGTCLSGSEGREKWFQHLYFDDLRCSILRFDITPRFKAPYSNFHYNSPWFGQAPPLNLPGPDHNNVRTYTGAADYGRLFGGHRAQIAVMGPDIDRNIEYFDFAAEEPKTAGLMARVGERQKAQLGDFKLIASMWSPAPWLKVSSGDQIRGQKDPLPKSGTPWPFIWGGNFSGGILDTSGVPRPEFDDRALGGNGPTSALTQFVRALAAYLRGFQETYGVKLYAISLQNELGFEEFYSSCAYPRSSDYIKVLKAARAELDKYPDLATIRIMGPEDVLGGDAYGMWQYGNGLKTSDKNLKILESIARDPDAEKALGFFCIHGYSANGVSGAGARPTQWEWWRNGWTAAPGLGLPSRVAGFASYGKKSWMTETSGEEPAWLALSAGFPGEGAWSIALKIEQALTAGDESAWLYWQLSDGKPVSGETLTDRALGSQSPKYIAAKHFFRYIRPGAVRVRATVDGSSGLLASAYVHDPDETLVVELINASASAMSVRVRVPAEPPGFSRFEVITSGPDKLWQTTTEMASRGIVMVDAPAYGIVTLRGTARNREGR